MLAIGPTTLLILGAILFAGMQWRDFRRGRVYFGYQWIERANDPFGFWFGHVTLGLLVVFALAFHWIMELLP